MAKKSGKRKGAEKKLTATVEKLRARVKKAESATDKWRAEANSLRAEAAKRAKQVKKLKKKVPTRPRDEATEGPSVAKPVPDESWTVLRLRAAASEAGVVGYSRMTKAALLDALK